MTDKPSEHAPPGSSRLLAAIRTLGIRQTARRAGRRLWSKSYSLGLRCDLSAMPPRRPAKIELRMLPSASADEAGLTDELTIAEGGTYVDVAQRIAMCEAGVGGLHVARSPDDEAVYCQWLIGPAEHVAIDRFSPGLYPSLNDGEVLLEGAYTYTNFRGVGAMADGMHQLLEKARERGEKAAFTYVAAEYPPSIRGCAKVGFVLDHISVRTRRFGIRRVRIRPADDAARAAWERANAPR
jgi:hypothetical protein